MNTEFLKKIRPEWPLRLGLGLTYLYSGYDIFFNPQGWVWAIPAWFADFARIFVSLEFYLRMQGVLEFTAGLLLLSWFSGKWGVRIASTFAVLEMSGILLFTGINVITFRDIGLLGAAAALLSLLFQSSAVRLET